MLHQWHRESDSAGKKTINTLNSKDILRSLNQVLGFCNTVFPLIYNFFLTLSGKFYYI